MKFSIKKLTIILFSLTVNIAIAQKVETVSGRATFYGESYDSPAKCRQEALAMARTDAIGRAFGWNLQGSTFQHEATDGERENTYFTSTNSMTVNGEWVSDIDIVYEHQLDVDGNLIVTCAVKGTARRLSNETVDFDAITLRNGLTRECASTEFVSDDPLYLLIRTPIDGYLAAYIVDDAMQAYCLLPYKNSASQSVIIKHDVDNIFFDKDSGAPEGVRLVTDAPVERDELIVVFSPNAFSKANDADTSMTLPRTLTFTELNDWLLRVHKNDPKLSVKRLPVVIRNS